MNALVVLREMRSRLKIGVVELLENGIPVANARTRILYHLTQVQQILLTQTTEYSDPMPGDIRKSFACACARSSI